ncbi:MAG: hypothetical protein KBT27_12150 [Prevotellaceae bacterium]|nr:hypothetical protein [Candidatus Faecinaster equi]
MLQEVKRYLQLEARFVALDATEKVAILLGKLLLIIVLLFFGFLVLLTGAFALAFWIGTLAGSQALGFLFVCLLMLALLLMVYAHRMQWIFMPVMSMITTVLLKKKEEDDPDDAA